jgi:hypothetical protein
MFSMQQRTRLSIGLGHECCTKVPMPSRLVDAQQRLSESRLRLILQLMDEGKIGHHHAKCPGPIHPAKHLSANSFQLISDLEGQRKNECGVNTLEWNVQPLVVVERYKLRLSDLALETHDDVFSKGVLFADFQHGKELVEIALGESGIDGNPELSALICGSNDSALRSSFGLLRSGHAPSSS